MEQKSEMLRPRELAALLGVSRSRIYQLIAAGEIPLVRIGGAIRIPRPAWDEWLVRKKRTALASLRPAARVRPVTCQ
jgi:excisionase family DNA binding protein